MRHGTVWSAAWGDPGNALEYAFSTLSTDQTRLTVRFKPRADLAGDWFMVYVSGRKLAHVLTYPGQESLARVRVPLGATEIALHVLHVGGCSDPLVDLSHVARGFESIDSKLASIFFSFTPEVLQPDSENDAGLTSAWSLSGLLYGINVETWPPYSTRGRLALQISVAAGIATVRLKRHGVTQAEGSIAVASLPGTVTLYEANSSGLSGSLTLSAAAIDTQGDLFIRWPKSVRIYRATTSPPTTLRATVPFTGLNSARWTERSALTSGTHYYRLAPVSDTNDEGTPSAIFSVTIPAPPGAPSSLAWKSGNAAATVLQFTASPTTGATYNLYLQQPGAAAMDFNAVAATAIAGATQITLPAIVGYPGIARAVLRAVKSGVEEQNNAALEIEYDGAGARVAPRPNGAHLDDSSLSVSGLAASFDGLYDSTGEHGTATTLKLFSRSPGGQYDYNTPDDSDTLIATGSGIKRAALSKTFPSTGWYYLRAIAYTASDIPGEAADSPELSIYVSNADVPAPDNVQADVARG